MVESTKRVGIWIRVSTEDQAKGDSPEHHERRARQYAEIKEWQVVEVYHLEGVSGKSVIAEKETQRMLADVKRGHIQGLLFSKLARLARNTKELLEFAELFETHGAHLVSLQESIDTSSPIGRFFYTVIAAMATWEREEIADRIRASVPIRAKLGKRLGSEAPFGYQWVDNKMVPNSREAPIRKLIFELFVEHKRKSTVADLLNDAGHRTRAGKLFEHTGIDRLLRDTTPKGLYRANYSTLTEGKKVIKPESEWIYSKVEPILSEELWSRVQHILLEQGGNKKVPARRPVHLFAGVTVCTCGGKMYVPSNTPKYVCQVCRNKIPIIDLEGIFYEQLKNFALSSADIKAYLLQSEQAITDKQEQLAALQAQQEKLSAEMDRTYKLYIGHHISEEGFAARYGPLETRYRELDEQIPRLEGELDYLKVNLLSSDQVAYEAADLYTRWPTLEHEDKRKIIEAITDKIEIGKDEILIDLLGLPSSEMMATSGHRL
ncbi:MAG: recombinase family protein [Candidatus Sumerlaeaceae bacterium]